MILPDIDNRFNHMGCSGYLNQKFLLSDILFKQS